MPTLDSVIEDTASRLGLGPKAGQLVREVVQMITGSPGGISGSIEKFRSAGFGPQVASWLGRTDGAVLTGPQVEQALGSSVLGGIANRLGLGGGVTGTAIGYLLPKLIGLMTPGGVIPSGIPAALSSYMQATPVQTTVSFEAAKMRVTPEYSRHRFRDALGGRDLPVMIGGGVLGMICGEILSASPVLQWAFIGGGIAFGIFISVAERARRKVFEEKSDPTYS
jgi:uncharacterized protein YidB (DUF937 family)